MLRETFPNAMAPRNSGSLSARRAKQRAPSAQRTLRSQRSSAYAANDENPSEKHPPRPITSSAYPRRNRSGVSSRASEANAPSIRSISSPIQRMQTS